MKVLDLFSGIGGFSLGLERAGMETVAFCEIDPFCQKVLKKHWPEVIVYDDIRTIRREFTGAVDLICGGYPCQPFSMAGKRKGAEDDRHLWPEMFACIRHYRPRWVIGENVAGHINMGLDNVLSDLESEGYTARAFVVPACAINAQHRRDRVWIVAHSACYGSCGTSTKSGEKTRRQNGIEAQQSTEHGCIQPLADTTSARQQGQGKFKQPVCPTQETEGETDYAFSECIGRIWEAEPNVGRVANGVPRRVDRLRALGNAVVPQIPEIIGKAIMDIDQQPTDRD